MSGGGRGWLITLEKSGAPPEITLEAAQCRLPLQCVDVFYLTWLIAGLVCRMISLEAILFILNFQNFSPFFVLFIQIQRSERDDLIETNLKPAILESKYLCFHGYNQFAFDYSRLLQMSDFLIERP